jgi:hypothetical protein
MPYAYLTVEHDCDGISKALYSAATFAEQSYYDESEAQPLTRDEFFAEYWPTFDSWTRNYWNKAGYCSLDRISARAERV